MSLAVERIQNYYQYKDAESKFYQLLKCENQEVSKEQAPQEVKAKKHKKSKKSSVSPDAGIVAEPTKEVKKANPIVKQDTEDLSVKTDSGIVDEPTSESAAAKKKSKSKKQREKKAAAALVAAQATANPPKESQPKEKIVIDLTPPTVAPAKPKDKKKKSKSSASEQKPKEDNAKNGVPSSSVSSNLVSEIANARQHIKTSLERVDGASALSGPNVQFLDRIAALEKDNSQLRNLVDGLQKLTITLEQRLNKLEGGSSAPAKSAPAPAKPTPAAADDDDVDLFGSDEEDDAEADRVKAERVAAYAAKKSNKPALIAKSSILLDIKPWDDETDMKEMERLVRTIQMDGLLMGVSKLVPLAYGINKLQMAIVIEDDKVSVDELQEKIEAFEDVVQSVDIAAFNKI